MHASWIGYADIRCWQQLHSHCRHTPTKDDLFHVHTQTQNIVLCGIESSRANVPLTGDSI